MNQRPRIIVIHCPTGGGHKAAAIAVAEAAATTGAEVSLLDALSQTPAWFASSYVQTHLKSTSHAPRAYGYGYARLNRRHPVRDRLRRAFDATMGRALVEHVAARDPDLIVATHFFPLSVLGRARLHGQIDAPITGAVTDYAAHAFWSEPGVDRYCVARGGPAWDLQHHGTPETAIVETGIPIRPSFGEAPALHARDLDGPLRVLITSGGFGIGPMAKTVRSFAGLQDLELTIICGDNRERMKQAERAARHTGLPWQVIGFERNMASRIANAHVVVGKPGGLTSSETLAAGRPLVTVGTCPGQEAHNAEWLGLNGAAVPSSAGNAGATVAWLRRAGRLVPMARAARRIAAPLAAHHVVQAALELLDGAETPHVRPQAA